MAHAINSSIEICMLSHGNWEKTNRAIESVIKFGYTLHVGLTVDCEPPLKHNQVFYYTVPWTNHFANARNRLLEVINTECTYILWIDSDEYISSMPAIDFSRFQDPILKIKLDYFSRNTPCLRATCHRRDPAIRWQGSIHEYLDVTTEMDTGQANTIPGLLVVHDGYDDLELLDEKHLRNLRIAKTGLESDRPALGELVALARHNMHFGTSSAFEWLAVYRMASHFMQTRNWLSDFRAEAAGSLALCGYFRPALAMIELNPFNISLQLSLLIAEYVYLGDCKERIQFVAHCLQRGYADSNYSYPLALIGMDVNALLYYVYKQGDDLKVTMVQEDITENNYQDMATQYQQVQGVKTESFEDDLILLSPTSLNIVSLNEIAAILWQTLSWPHSINALVDMMLEAFPDRLVVGITHDVKTLINSLAKEGLIYTDLMPPDIKSQADFSTCVENK